MPTMTRRVRGALDDDDFGTMPTALDCKALSSVTPSQAKPDDSTLPGAPSGYRMSASVEDFTLAFKETRVKVTEGVASLGSHAGNALVVGDPTVSRYHAEIRFEDDRLLVRDLGSTNGTFIDGVRVKEGFLKAGNVLRLGPPTCAWS
jgi:hypothetical protein